MTCSAASLYDYISLCVWLETPCTSAIHPISHTNKHTNTPFSQSLTTHNPTLRPCSSLRRILPFCTCHKRGLPRLFFHLTVHTYVITTPLVLPHSCSVLSVAVTCPACPQQHLWVRLFVITAHTHSSRIYFFSFFKPLAIY